MASCESLLWKLPKHAVKQLYHPRSLIRPPCHRHLTSATHHTATLHSFLPRRTVARKESIRGWWHTTSHVVKPKAIFYRPFNSSRQLRKAILNPRQDEDGNEMLVEITPRAANRLKQIMTTDSNPNLALRVSVESGGCHGFQYLMSLTDMSKVSEEEDTVFEGRDGSKVVMDEPSLELLKGSKVDYTMELIGSQFKIVDNPLATSSCGCGTSFDIKA